MIDTVLPAREHHREGGFATSPPASAEMSKKQRAEEAGPLQVGELVLDRYRVVGHMETGGTSVVYQGEDERLSRPVCIKVFHTLKYKDRIYRTTYEHFIQEAFALSKLTHPNTLRIYDFAHLEGADGKSSGAPFQVSEFMNGGTLSTLVRTEGALKLPEVIHIVTALCGALEEAHELGIIHRDVKPRNILFGTTATKRSPKLADFGIAKALEVEHDSLRNRAGETQIVAGRKLLMYSGLWAAPEQLAARQVSRASDVYSMALLSAYMLTGRCVFAKSDPADAYKERKRSDEHIDRALGPRLPEAMTALLKSTCNFEAERRPTVAGFAKLFAEILSNLDRPPPRAPIAAPVLEVAPNPDSIAEVAPNGPPQPISVSGEPQPVSDRVAYFVPFRGHQGSNRADIRCAAHTGDNARIRITMVPTGPAHAVHVKGLTCFVAKKNGRLSSATQLSESGRIELADKRQKTFAKVAVLFPRPAAGHSVFQIGDQLVAIRNSQARQVIALDFGPRNDCFFLYVPTVSQQPEVPARSRRKSR